MARVAPYACDVTTGVVHIIIQEVFGVMARSTIGDRIRMTGLYRRLTSGSGRNMIPVMTGLAGLRYRIDNPVVENIGENEGYGVVTNMAIDASVRYIGMA